MAKCALFLTAFVYTFFQLQLTWLAGVGVCQLITCNVPKSCSATGFEEQTTTRLKVVLPSAGQTGTTSVMEAIRMMGYRSYHSEEKMVFTATSTMDLQIKEILALELSRCGVEAISLEPGFDALPFILDTSPDAKFILTWRSFPRWYNSTISGGSKKDQRFAIVSWKLAVSVLMFPWGAIFNNLTGVFSDFVERGDPFGGGNASVVSIIAYKALGVYDSPLHGMTFRGTFKVAAQEEAYLAHIDEIRRLVPPSRLLEFNFAEHGWAELSEFLGRPAPPAGTPFPHSRNKGSRTNDVHFYRQWGVSLVVYGIFTTFHAINFLMLFVVVRLVAFFYGLIAIFVAMLLLRIADLDGPLMPEALSRITDKVRGRTSQE